MDLQNNIIKSQVSIKQYILNQDIPALINEVLNYSNLYNASDIHFEALNNSVKVRLRIDGVLDTFFEYPKSIHPSLVSRIKLLAGLKIDEQRLPQDGRMDFNDGEEAVDLRVSVFPTVHGEKIVIRLLNNNNQILSLKELGFNDKQEQIVNNSLKKNKGIILVTGPTGSGKTTTLYSFLNILNNNNVNILTIEDPVEKKIEGINQSQVFEAINYSFEKGLKSALRQDPDIIMVGEIRDESSLDIAIKASLTGHLVLSTIHTNSTIETITRLLNMGALPYLLSSSIRLIIAQRLVRKICDTCRTEKEITDTDKLILNKILDDNNISIDLSKVSLFEGKGCEHCNNSGFKGRVGIYELLEIDDELKEHLDKSFELSTFKNIAVRNGLTNLDKAGLLKVFNGETTLGELRKI